MRILFCNYEYPPLGGGGGVINALLAEELAKRHEVTVLTSQGLGLAREQLINGVSIVRVPAFFRKRKAVANLHSMLAFIPMGIGIGKKLVAANQFDVINTHFVLPTGPVGDALSRASGAPNVLSLHGGDLYDPSKFMSPHRHLPLRIWIRWLLRRADVVVGQSRNTLANMRHFYTPEIEGTRIPLAIQKPQAGVASRTYYGFDDNDVLLVTVGRLIPRKGLDQLVSLTAAFNDKKVHLLIIGSGPAKANLKEKALKQQVGDQVHFLGYVEESEKQQVLQMSDLYVSSSQHEGFGLVFLEAMAAGLPVVCYDHGGQTDFLVDQKTGYLVPLNNHDRFIDRCRFLIDNPATRKNIGEHNKGYVEDYYIGSHAAKYESTYYKALELGASRERVRFFQRRTV